MVNTDKDSCRIIADLLSLHGVKKAVLCPGSRNAPLLVAISRHPGISVVTAIDERSAAFQALGYALISGEPVAVVCTSGSAMLNFAPAVAEAYYRRVPLIAITADRPAEWIDQDDSQTIRQIGALGNIVKGTYDIPVENGTDVQQWLINRTVNDAILMAMASPMGPVHINVQLDVPLGRLVDGREQLWAQQRVIAVENTNELFDTRRIRQLGAEIASPVKTLIIAGFMPPDQKLNRAMLRLAQKPNIAIMQEAQANLHGQGNFITRIDSTLSALSPEQRREMLPDVVITLGGSLVSRFVKSWLRNAYALAGKRPRHWHVGTQDYSVDCFQCLEKRIMAEPRYFMSQLASAVQLFTQACDYAAKWRQIAQQAMQADEKYLRECPWSDFRAMAMLMRSIPRGWNLQLSNGTAVRYAQLFDYSRLHRIDCNRGVSGIDGCLSTAVGAQAAYPGNTLLITGDMSAQYDVGALAATAITPKFKMAVLNNGGGGIFRFVDSTAQLPEREELFCADVRLPLRQLADGYGFAYYEARDAESMRSVLPGFLAQSQQPAILNMITPPELSAEILRAYFVK